MDPPPAMVRDAVTQLQKMHNINNDKSFKVPEPLSAAFVNWTVDPYSVRSWEVIPRIRRPVDGVNVFLCGEAFSPKQGWVEGAINAAEKTLETIFFRAASADMAA
jgi:monoamine oxidase